MQELVGNCNTCGKQVYCLDGFLNGIHSDGQLLCFDCAEQTEREKGAQE